MRRALLLSALSASLLASGPAWLASCSQSETPPAPPVAAPTAEPPTTPPPTDPAPGESAKPPARAIRPLEERPLYLVMVDRFFDGDASNNDLGAPNCHGPEPKIFQGGDLAGLEAKLGYIAELSVGTLWTTPLNAQTPRGGDSCGHHGYWADFTFPDDGRMEPKLGTLEAAIAMRDAAHGAGMRWLIDLVVNHAGYGARIASQKPEWFHTDDDCAKASNKDEACALYGLPDFEHDKQEVRDYLDAMSRGWVARLSPDGIRMDTEKHVPTSYFATSWIPAVRAEKKGLFLLAERFDDGDIASYKATFDAGFDSAFHFPLRRALVSAYMKGGSLGEVAGVIARTQDVYGNAFANRLVTFLDNHDTARFLSEASGIDDASLEQRYRAAAALFYALPGVPQLYQGDELAARGVFPENRRTMPSWAWTAASRAGAHEGYLGDGEAWHALFVSLGRLRASEPALQYGKAYELWRPGGENVYVFVRQEGASQIAVVASLEAGDVDLSVPFFDNPTVPISARVAWADAVELVDVAGAGAPAKLKVEGGQLRVQGRGVFTGIYRTKPL